MGRRGLDCARRIKSPLKVGYLHLRYQFQMPADLRDSADRACVVRGLLWEQKQESESRGAA